MIKKLTKLTKALLVAVMLLGGASCAWAGKVGVVTTNAKVLFNGSITVADPCTYSKGSDEVCGTSQGWFWKASGSDVSTGGGIDGDGHMTFNNGNMTIAMTNGTVGAKDIVNVSFWIAFGGHCSENANQTIQLLTSGENIVTETYNNTNVVSSTMGLSATDLEAIGFGGSWRNTSWSERVKFNFTLNYATRKISLVIINASNVEKVNKEIDMPEGAGYITGINIKSSNQRTTERGILLDNVYITTTEGDYGDIVSGTNSYTVNNTDKYQLFTEVQCPDITMELWGNGARSTTDYYFKYTDGAWASYDSFDSGTETADYTCTVTKYTTDAPTAADIYGADSPSNNQIAKVTVTVSDRWLTETAGSELVLSINLGTTMSGWAPTAGAIYKFTPTENGYLNLYFYKYSGIQYRVWVSGNKYEASHKTSSNEYYSWRIWMTKNTTYYIFSTHATAYQMKVHSFEFIPEVTKTITSCGWTTFASPYALDLSSMTASEGPVEAYYASNATGSTVTLTSTESSAVAAGEGLMLKGTAGATITIPVVASGSAIAGNLLKGQTTEGTVEASNKGNNGKYHYVFGYTSSTDYGFYNLADDATVPAGKAYLETESALTPTPTNSRLSIVFGDEATGIEKVNGSQLTVDGYYNLNGQRVAQPSKGLYIKNGKKVIMK